MLPLLRPETRGFIESQVQSGRFPTAEAVIEAAIDQLSDSLHGVQLTPADITAINEAERQADRGEGMELEDFKVHMRRRMAKP